MKSINLRKQENSVPGSKALLAIVVAFCFSHTQSFAQMKVGLNPTTINAGSVLELESANQGVLLPRVSLNSVITVWLPLLGLPADGMFVFNLNASTGTTGIGVYYWANSKWNYVQNGAAANTGWLITGNAGTNPGTYPTGTNFIGTTDGVDFAVRTTNAERMRISAAGQIGINQNFLATQQLAVTTGVAANTAVVGQNTTASNTSTGIGVLGTTLQSGGYGVKGTNGNAAGIAILGQNTAVSGTGGNGIGVEGISAQSYKNAPFSNGYGVVALNTNPSGTGLYAAGNNVGLNTDYIVGGSGASLVGTNIGGFGSSSGNVGSGLYGFNYGAGGRGVYGKGIGASSYGVFGYNDNISTFQTGVYGTYNTAGHGTGVVGVGAVGSVFGAATTLDIGVYGSALDFSVMGYNTTGGIGVYGYSEGSSTGVFGINNDAQSFGVWGVNSNSSGTGVVGGGNGLISSYFVQGQGGAFTGSEIGASGVIPIAADGGTFGTSYSEGSYGLFGRASRYIATTNQYGDVYQFGVYGEKIGYGFTAGQGGGYSERRSGGVLGLYYDDRVTGYAAWGSLGYVASTNSGTGTAGLAYGVYATAAPVRGTGYTGESNDAGFGIGAFGGLMGGWVRGDFYGMNLKGERYGLYIDGYTYSNKPSVQLIDNGGEERTVAYNVSSLSADVYAHGKGKMVNGKAQITFERGFTQIVDESDLAVTVTPIGESNGVHLVASTGTGFSLQENKNADNSFGSSDAEFTWIAVGKRKDVKSADIAKEVLSKDFDKNMDGVMFNENDMEHSAGSMQFTDGKLKFTPVTNSEKPVNVEKLEIRKALKAVPPKNANLKGDKLKMEKPEQEKNKVIVNKTNNNGQKSDPPPAPKKD